MSATTDRPKLVDATKRSTFSGQLKQISAHVQSGKQLHRSLRKVELQLLKVLKVHRFAIYQSVDNGNEMVSAYQTGIRGSDADVQIRIPMGPGSIVGFVALSQSPVLLTDVEDEDELTAIHPRLKHSKGESTRSTRDIGSMIAVPITDEILLGVLQITTSKSEPALSQRHLQRAKLVAAMLSKKLSSLIKIT